MVKHKQVKKKKYLRCTKCDVCFVELRVKLSLYLEKSSYVEYTKNWYHSYTNSYVETHVVQILCLGPPCWYSDQHTAHITQNTPWCPLFIILSPPLLVPPSQQVTSCRPKFGDPPDKKPSHHHLSCWYIVISNDIIFLPLIHKRNNNDLLSQQPTWLPRRQRRWWCQ